MSDIASMLGGERDAGCYVFERRYADSDDDARCLDAVLAVLRAPRRMPTAEAQETTTERAVSSAAGRGRSPNTKKAAPSAN